MSEGKCDCDCGPLAKIEHTIADGEKRVRLFKYGYFTCAALLPVVGYGLLGVFGAIGAVALFGLFFLEANTSALTGQLNLLKQHQAQRKAAAGMVAGVVDKVNAKETTEDGQYL